MPEDLRSQMPWVRRALEAYRIPILELQGYEADDVLGTLACRAAEAGYEVVIVSADKDLMQLVEPRVSLYHTGRNKLYGPKDVEEDFGVSPAKVVDVLALMGDSIDNIPGVPGIGDKGAKSLIQEHGSLEALLDNAAKVSRKAYREGLEQHREQALLSKELSTIHTNVDVAFDPTDLRLDAPDNDALRQLFTELEFFSLVEELKSAAPAAGQELPPVVEASTPAVWEERTGGMGSQEIFAAVLGEDRPIGLAIARGGEDGEGEVTVADFRKDGLREAALATLDRWIADPAVRLSGHNLKEVLRLSPAGPTARAALFDAMLVSYLLKPSVHGHTFDELALERLSCKPITAREAGWDKGQEPPVGDSRLASYACERVTFARRMAGAMRQELGAGPLFKVYEEIEAPAPPRPARHGRGRHPARRGLPAHHVRELGKELATLEEEIYRQAGERFNLGSPQQIGFILFERMGLPVLKRTQKTKSYSTGAEILEELASRGYPIATSLLRHRELTKLKSTYVDALPLMVAADGRIHTRFNQAVAATGRLSSTNPNLQNIPIRTELGQRIRRAFVAAPGHVLLVADYSQIELRILAHIAEEKELIRGFRGRRGHPPLHGGGRLRRGARAGHGRAAPGGQDDQLRDPLRHERVRPGPGAEHPAARGRGLHQGLPGPLLRRPHLCRGDAAERREGGQGRDPLRPRALAARHPEQEPQPARERPAHGDQRAHPGHGGRPPQAGDDRHRPPAAAGALGLAAPPHRPRRAGPGGSGGGRRGRGRPGQGGDGGRRRASGPPGGGRGMGAELVRGEKIRPGETLPPGPPPPHRRNCQCIKRLTTLFQPSLSRFWRLAHRSKCRGQPRLANHSPAGMEKGTLHMKSRSLFVAAMALAVVFLGVGAAFAGSSASPVGATYVAGPGKVVDPLNHTVITVPKGWYAAVPRVGTAGVTTLTNYDAGSARLVGAGGNHVLLKEMAKIDVLTLDLRDATTLQGWMEKRYSGNWGSDVPVSTSRKVVLQIGDNLGMASVVHLGLSSAVEIVMPFSKGKVLLANIAPVDTVDLEGALAVVDRVRRSGAPSPAKHLSKSDLARLTESLRGLIDHEIRQAGSLREDGKRGRRGRRVQ